MSLNLAGKTIWITGASRGIGASTAEKLLNTGATLILSSRNSDSLKITAKKYAYERKVMLMPCDIRSKAEVGKAYDRIKSLYGKVDILINNAGVGTFKPFIDLSEEDYDAMMDTNVKGTFLCTQAVLPEMIESGSGLVINILSISALTSFESSSVYSASKAALLAMDRALRKEISHSGVKLIDMLPGAVETEIWDEESRRELGNRMIQPEDFADAVISMIDLADNPRMTLEEITIRPQWGDL